MKKLKVNSFVWAGWVKPTNQVVGDITVFAGNFVMELILPNALKITSFKKLRVKLNNYIKHHNGKVPECFRLNKRQYHEYTQLFGSGVYVNGAPPNVPLFYQGIPLLLHMSLFKGFDILCKK